MGLTSTRLNPPLSFPELLKSAKEIVKDLCKIPRYNLNELGMKQAANYINTQFKKLNYRTERQEYKIDYERIKDSKLNIIEKVYNPEKIRKDLEALAQVSSQDYTYSFPRTATNLLTSIGSTNEDARVLVVGAHYDTDPFQVINLLRCMANSIGPNMGGFIENPLDDPSSNPGADDNASGIAGLLLFARLLKEDPEIEKKLIKKNIRVELVAYANEEQPFFDTEFMGSKVHARSLKERGAENLGMICLESIGYFSNNKQRLPDAITGKHTQADNLKGNFIAILSNRQKASDKLGLKLTESFKNIQGLITKFYRASVQEVKDLLRSDNSSYWEEDLPAVMITDTFGFRNPSYHKSEDIPKTLNYDNIVRISQALFKYVDSLCTKQ
jgi:hypothetical protein